MHIYIIEQCEKDSDGNDTSFIVHTSSTFQLAVKWCERAENMQKIADGAKFRLVGIIVDDYLDADRLNVVAEISADGFKDSRNEAAFHGRPV